MIRDDGSVRSANSTWNTRFQARDYGLYRGVIKDVIYIDDDRNSSGGPTPANEVLYNVMIVGGERDGQIFANARVMKTLGGFDNWEEVILKKTEGLSGLDHSNLLAAVDPHLRQLRSLSGDVVYIQFLNGVTNMPVIVGLGHHQVAEMEATADQGQRFRRKFNGIQTEIDKDGMWTFSKDNGAFLPAGINPRQLLYPFINQFSVFPGQQLAVVATLDNQYNFLLKYNPLGLNVSISGLSDEFVFTTSSGASLALRGAATDAFSVATLVGTAINVTGTSDAIALTTAVGTAITVTGTSDTISLATKAGHALTMAAASGVALANAAGSSVNLPADGSVALTSATQAFLKLDPAGFVKLGNAAGDALAVLADLLQALTTEAPAGFGAPLVGLPKYIELLTKIKLITGG